ALLGHPVDAVLNAHLLRIAAQPAVPGVDDGVQEQRQTLPDGLCALPQGDQRAATRLGRTEHGRCLDPLDGDAARRSLRRAGTAATARRGYPRLFPQGPLNAMKPTRPHGGLQHLTGRAAASLAVAVVDRETAVLRASVGSTNGTSFTPQ